MGILADRDAGWSGRVSVRTGVGPDLQVVGVVRADQLFRVTLKIKDAPARIIKQVRSEKFVQSPVIASEFNAHTYTRCVPENLQIEMVPLNEAVNFLSGFLVSEHVSNGFIPYK